jgi:hypothetical protein
LSHTSAVKKSLAASVFQIALKNVDHFVCLRLSGAGWIALRLDTFATVPRPTL